MTEYNLPETYSKSESDSTRHELYSFSRMDDLRTLRDNKYALDGKLMPQSSSYGSRAYSMPYKDHMQELLKERVKVIDLDIFKPSLSNFISLN